jgi:hypothetical protein
MSLWLGVTEGPLSVEKLWSNVVAPLLATFDLGFEIFLKGVFPLGLVAFSLGSRNTQEKH